MGVAEFFRNALGTKPVQADSSGHPTRYGGPLGSGELLLGDVNPADGIGIGLTGPGSAATRGAGVLQYVDQDGEPQAIPVTQSSFYPAPLWSAEEISEVNDEFAETGLSPYVVDPPVNLHATEERTHEQIHGPVPPLVEKPWTVNPWNPGVPNLGPEHEQPAFTSRTQVVPHVQSEEQGWGMEGRVAEERFPLVQGPNPYYNFWAWRRNGALDFSSEGVPFGRVTNAGVQAIEELRRNRSSVHQRVVDNPASVYFSETVPVEGQAGPIPEPLSVHDEAIY